MMPKVRAAWLRSIPSVDELRQKRTTDMHISLLSAGGISYSLSKRHMLNEDCIPLSAVL